MLLKHKQQPKPFLEASLCLMIFFFASNGTKAGDSIVIFFLISQKPVDVLATTAIPHCVIMDSYILTCLERNVLHN